MSGMIMWPRQNAVSSDTHATERPVRTHWDMLLERRSIADLEELLEERLALLDQAPSELPKSA
jgi:hypothetical protein